MKFQKKIALLVMVIFALAWMIIDSFNQPGPEDLKGGFKEKLFIRNEQNSGPVVRIYLVTVKDTLWREMETYGNYKPHTKYGKTIVYYFPENRPTPKEVSLTGNNISIEYQKYCVAKYEKSPMGQILLVKKPFSK